MLTGSGGGGGGSGDVTQSGNNTYTGVNTFQNTTKLSNLGNKSLLKTLADGSITGTTNVVAFTNADNAETEAG